jgi:cytochrome c553
MRQIFLAGAMLLLAPAVFAAGDSKAGRSLVYTCTGCHGIAGYKNAYPNYHVPKIGGQNYEYLVTALKEYRTGERKHPTMRAQAESMSDQDIEDISTYLSELSDKETK